MNEFADFYSKTDLSLNSACIEFATRCHYKLDNFSK